jgi:DNA-binding XRE family transcriptional regulator
MAAIQSIVTPKGEELVVISRRDYEDLLARAEVVEDRETRRLVARTNGAAALHEAVWESIEGGVHPVRAIRRFRGMTQAALASASGVSQSYIAGIERSRKSGRSGTLKAIARSLRVTLDGLIP